MWLALISSSILLHRIGFSCITSDEGYQVGPFAVNDTITEEHVEQMYKYMLRSWVEVSLYLQDFRRRNGEWLRRLFRR